MLTINFNIFNLISDIKLISLFVDPYPQIHV
jgi:hypothetical protein